MDKFMANKNCPVCEKSETVSSVSRDNLITMQNYVYRDYEKARESPVGKFELRACRNCGFAYNAGFDPSLMSYDENYDNQVPSKIFLDYYERVARFLYDKYKLENGFVIDVGCGKGTFLKVLCGLYPAVRGLGIDPSYEASDSTEEPKNLTFIQDVFRSDYITEQPSLVICRHVLEHIDRPVSFLSSIRTALVSSNYTETPFFVEVPDLDWIIENGAFWDFCYEHCNYFTLESLSFALELAGFQTEEGYKAFGGQYLWMRARIKPDSVSIRANETISGKVTDYAREEEKLMSAIRAKLVKLKAKGSKTVVWGMATKGVVFCNLIDPGKKLIDYCVDINANKQNCFVPHTGHLISAPTVLKTVNSTISVVIVMNPNYVNEIKESCRNLNLKATFIDANGNDL